MILLFQIIEGKDAKDLKLRSMKRIWKRVLCLVRYDSPWTEDKMTVRKRPGGLKIEIYKNYVDHELKIQNNTSINNMYQEDMVRQRTMVTGKAATFHVKIM